MGDFRPAAGLPATRPVCSAQAKNTRAAATRRCVRGAGLPEALLLGQPATQRPPVHVGQPLDTEPSEVVEEPGEVGAVGAYGVLGEATLSP